MKSLFRIPVFRFVAAVLLAIAIFGLTLFASLDRPTIKLPTDATLLSLNGVSLLPSDTIEEPDQLGSFSDMQAFFDRQTLFAAMLAKDTVTADFRTSNGAVETRLLAVRESRLVDLPFVFWFQNAVGLLAVFVSGWVVSLRSSAAVSSLFALGLGLQLSASAASVYGSRQLAIPGDFFRTMSDLNHLGTAIFGIALVAVFMMFPRQLVRPIWLIVPIVVFGLFHLSDTLRWTDSPSFAIAIVTQLLLAIGLGIVQWRRSRGEPIERAGLRWFSLCTFTGCVLFVAFSILPPVLGIAETGLFSQGYAFGFFAAIHIGLALGIARFRLFSLDKFTYYMWIWLSGGALILGLDFALLYWIQIQPWASLAAALFIASFLYFPLRQFLVARILKTKSASIVGKVQDVVSVGLAPTQNSRDASWDALLRDVFRPASEITEIDRHAANAEIFDDGLTLEIPSTRDLKARQLRYANFGRRLFNQADLDVVGTLTQIYATVVDSRAAYETGVTEERGRIARDVHDNIGAQLLSALHTPEEGRKDAVLRDTLSDLRTIVNEGFQNTAWLQDVLLDIRHEMSERLEVHGTVLKWSLDNMPDLQGRNVAYSFANSLRAMLREATSNSIKHAKATEVTVLLQVTNDMLDVTYKDNGTGFAPNSNSNGNGIKNIQDRATDLDGRAEMRSEDGGAAMVLHLPLAQVQNGAALE